MKDLDILSSDKECPEFGRAKIFSKNGNNSACSRRLMSRLYKHITIAKLIGLALLFTPLWGVWWFNADHGALNIWIEYLLKGGVIAPVYTGLCVLAVIGFSVVAFIGPVFVRVPLMVIMLIGWAFELCLLDLNGAPSNQDLLWILWQNREDGVSVISAYGTEIIRDCILVAVIGVVLCAPPARHMRVAGVFGFLPLLAGVSVAGAITYTKGGTQDFPIPFATFSNASIVLLSIARGESWPNPDPNFSRDVTELSDVQIEGRAHPIFNKIVMIMDESIRGDYLSLNDSDHKTTPFLNSADHLVNFGVAISGANCSSVARAIFRFGMRQSDLPNNWSEGLSRPTIWQLAHRAGYETVHIDAWGRPLLQRISGLSPAEEAQVDKNITVLENPRYLRDQKVVDRLLQVLQRKGPTFVYVDKEGLHFPYSDKYPPNFRALPEPSENPGNLNQTDWSLGRFLKGFMPPSGKDPSEQEIAHYPNAIAWSVDEFFKKLLPHIDLSSTLIIYTSDHGQSLLPHHFTHCSTTPPIPSGEAYVPLLAVTALPEFERRLRKGAVRSFGHFSHFEVFPTLLLAMGYDPGWVSRNYGPSLMETPYVNRKFMIGAPGFHPSMIKTDAKFGLTR
jgi:glucan phosphoethanolaminetransferase (alkaline phosphatase superfamily)